MFGHRGWPDDTALPYQQALSDPSCVHAALRTALLSTLIHKSW